MDWDLNSVSYVYVELVSNKKIIAGSANISTMSDVVAGLFAGIKIDTCDATGVQEKFIMVKDNKKHSHALSVDEHTIMSISKLSGDVKKMAFFRCEDPDQTKAYDMLETTMEALIDQKRGVGDTAMINTESYHDLPTEFTGEGQKKIKPVTSHYNSGTTIHRPTHQPYVDTSKKMRVFRRKTKKPDEKDLTKLREMIKLISEGKEVVKFPIVECDIPEQEEEGGQEGSVWQNYDSYK